jgi:hypothetical protein
VIAFARLSNGYARPNAPQLVKGESKPEGILNLLLVIFEDSGQLRHMVLFSWELTGIPLKPNVLNSRDLPESVL